MLQKLLNRFMTLESMVNQVGPDSITGYVGSEFKRRAKSPTRRSPQYGIFQAMCVQTIDPWKQNRVQYYHPLFCHPDDPLDKMPFAYAVSAMGGFDDSGLNWVPPAGSTLMVFFEHGNRNKSFYIGTTWHRDRGPDRRKCGGQVHKFGYPIKEYDCLYENHRKGYLVGPNDGSQVFPPWNTENYNNYDHNTTNDFFDDVESVKRVTWPHIYGFKTPEKHMLKMVDGNAKCNRRYKRLEIMSGTGNWLMMKDDHLRPAGEWAHTNMGPNEPPRFESRCQFDADGNPIATQINTTGGQRAPCADEDIDKAECSKTKDIFTDCGTAEPILGDCVPRDDEEIKKGMNKGTNPYFKHANECRPYRGPGTQQNNQCALSQSGMQFCTIAGNTWVGDDAVEVPRGCPDWEKSLESFDYGETNIYKGKTFWKSAHGHIIEMNDHETFEDTRDENNYIRMMTATGHRFEMNDHTLVDECVAGEFRGITLQSTSNHTIEMMDADNEQCSPTRTGWSAGLHNGYPAHTPNGAGSSSTFGRDNVPSEFVDNAAKFGGIPVPKAKRAFVKIRTGYGLQMEFNDAFTQEQKVEQQFIQIFSPQYEEDCGPHIMRFQELPGGGLVFLRAGGNYIIYTCKDMLTVVGDQKEPASRFTIVSRSYLVDVKEYYYNHADIHIFFAEKYIILAAGRDCKDDNPCLYPVMVGKCLIPNPFFPFILHPTIGSLSDRVFASASEATTAADCGVFV